MNDQSSLPIQALPDGEAELRLVLRLRWEDVAALGQEAGQLAAELKRPVSLDEAVSHRLRNRAAHAKPLHDRGQHAVPAAVGPGHHSPHEQARQAIDKINGSAPASLPMSTAPASGIRAS